MKQWYKYIVEVFIIILSILAAFWLEGWRKNNEEIKFKRKILSELISSIDSDLLQLENIITTQKNAHASAEIVILDIESKGTLLPYDSVPVNIVRANMGIFTYYPQDGLFNLITTTDIISHIESRQLRSLIFKLYNHDIERLKNINLLIDRSYLDYQEVFESNGIHFGSGIKLQSSNLTKEYYLNKDLLFSLRRISSWSGAYLERLNEIKPQYIELKELCLKEIED